MLKESDLRNIKQRFTAGKAIKIQLANIYLE